MSLPESGERKRKSRKHSTPLELRFDLNAPAGATEAQKRGAVIRAIFEGELPEGYSWASGNPVHLRNPELKRGKYKTWQAETIEQSGKSLRRIFRKAYEGMGRAVTRKQQKEMAEPLRPAKIPKRARQIAAKKGHRKQARREKKLSKVARRKLSRERSRAVRRAWKTRRKRYGKSGRKGKGKRGRK